MPGLGVLLPILLTISVSSRAGVNENRSGLNCDTPGNAKVESAVLYQSNIAGDDWPVMKLLYSSWYKLSFFKACAIEKAHSDGILSGIRSYTNSDDFKSLYRQWRELHKPLPNSMTDAEIVAQKKELKSAITLYRQIMRNCFDCSEREVEKMNQSISVLNDRIQLLNTPDPATAIWETRYPEHSDLFIANSLKQFIDITANVDFRAALKHSNDNISFANSYYEQKNYLWKFCFHAGKETTDTLRKLATEWLHEISNNDLD